MSAGDFVVGDTVYWCYAREVLGVKMTAHNMGRVVEISETGTDMEVVALGYPKDCAFNISAIPNVGVYKEVNCSKCVHRLTKLVTNCCAAQYALLEE